MDRDELFPVKHYDRCYNPCQLKNHCKRKDLRHPSLKILQNIPTLTRAEFLCRSCADKINKNPVLPHKNASRLDINYAASSSGNSFSTNSQTSESSLDTQLPVINEALGLLEQSPIVKKRATCSKHYNKEKADEVRSALLKSVGIEQKVNKYSVSESIEGFEEMINTLKEKIQLPGTKYEEKLQILTLLPKNWSVQVISRDMGVTLHMAKRAKELRQKTGVFSKPHPKKDKPISDITVSNIVKFYQDDRVSVVMPGMKDFISVRNNDGIKIHQQKRLILSNLKELYCTFQQEFTDIKVGFSTFADLRPRHCVLAGSSGTQTVCVCSLHQNLKLMIRSKKKKTLSKDHLDIRTAHIVLHLSGCNLRNNDGEDSTPATYEDCLSLLICNDPLPDCYFGTCIECPGLDDLREYLLEALDEYDTITYKQWLTKPRSSLETITKNVTEFADEFCDQAKKLLSHSFIAKKQSNFLKELKDTLEADNFVVVCDFAENYAFVVQDAAPGFHWNNNQATIYPVVIYFKVDGILHHRSLVIISSCLNHDAIAVYVLPKNINNLIKSISENPHKISYFSDGAPQQFKNFKNFLNLYYHQLDFNVPAVWLFFATAHGKGPCDGLGGTLKRLAARASLQLPPERQITTPEELYSWACEPTNIPSVTVKYTDQADYDEAKDFLSSHFNTGKPIPRTQQVHCVYPGTNGILITKRYSTDTLYETHRICKNNC